VIKIIRCHIVDCGKEFETEHPRQKYCGDVNDKDSCACLGQKATAKAWRERMKVAPKEKKPRRPNANRFRQGEPKFEKGGVCEGTKKAFDWLCGY
jgi:hypothetical protein